MHAAAAAWLAPRPTAMHVFVAGCCRHLLGMNAWAETSRAAIRNRACGSGEGRGQEGIRGGLPRHAEPIVTTDK
jgi:hypothetical protein